MFYIDKQNYANLKKEKFPKVIDRNNPLPLTKIYWDNKGTYIGRFEAKFGEIEAKEKSSGYY